MFFLDSSIVLRSGIYVGMPQDIRNHINIAGFVIKSGSVCTPELMWGKFFTKPH